jgi:hypothetical protein
LPLEEVEDPLFWWSKHEGQFLTIAKLAKAILGIPSNQIETKKVFSITSILTSLHHCRFGPKNLDFLLLLIKNRPDDPIIKFEAKGGPLKDVDEFGDADEEILDLLNAKFANEVEGYVEECVQNWDMFP